MISLRAFGGRLDAAGFLPPELEPKRASLARLVSLFLDRFGSAEREIFAAFVPGRIEVLGKHTDYAGGHSLLAALDRGYLVLAAGNELGRVRIVEDSVEFEPVDFPVSAGLEPRRGHWSNYPVTAVKRVAANFASRELRGMDLVFSSDLAVGSGMSSSSALIIMTFAALTAVNGLERSGRFRENVRDGVDLAMYLACVENGQTFRALEGGKGVGTFGGSEDHTSILNARSSCLSLYRFAPTSWRADIAWPEDWVLAVCFSGVRAEKTREALEKYNRLSLRSRAAIDGYNSLKGTAFATLRELADQGEREGRARGGAGASGDPVPPEVARVLRDVPAPDEAWDLEGRLRQFCLEDRLFIPRGVTALVARDGGAFGETISASHEASARFLANIVEEIDWLRRSAVGHGAWGASGFGAGFGGSAYAVLPASGAPAFLERWREGYLERFPERDRESWFLLTRPASGLVELSRDRPGRWVDGLFG